ncbi:conserved membrane hypothetical protein [Nostocoides japonicum T1-X7]|uniref:Uncharacterized protein n=1 Tax=Nostocoides japonicum T1-X7 TaxID=1194083 RepID=A0A077LWZ1_9MICO|nr:hypothetical protein [Tetrasphaera japonica]CCH76460.1 conserved membrane hypothetical protein [Tetrasphaera japonica T1-X7]
MTPRRLSLLLAAVGVLVLGLVGVVLPGASAATTPATSGAAATPHAPVILIGTGGLTWSDVSQDRTPALWSYLRDGSSGVMTIRSVFTNTCPIDGWLGISSGARAAGPGPDGKVARRTTDPCPPISPVVDGRVRDWPVYEHSAASNRFDAHLGLLGDEAKRGGVCITAVGPGAAVAAARSDGSVDRYADYDPARLAAELAACPIAVVDVGSVRDPADVAPGEAVPAATKEEQVEDVDARIGAVTAAAPKGADILLGSLSDAGRSERLRLAAAQGPAYGPGTLDSPSTRQPGLIQIQDLTVTVLDRAGLPVPDDLGGAVLGSHPADSGSESLARDRLRHLVDYDQASHEVHSLVPPFFNGVVYTQLVIYALVALFWKGKIGSERTRLRAIQAARIVAVVASTVPAASFLANLLPWWRFESPMLGVVGAVALFVALLSAVALLGPWGRTLFGPMVVVTTGTMLVLGIDVMTGSRLQLSSLMGLQPVIGGRYYGMGNVTFALFATSALLLATVVANHYVVAGRPRVAALAAGAVCVVAVVVDGAPFWGADGGGPPAMIPAAAYLVLSVLGIRITWRRALLLAVGTVALFLLVMFLDWLRPPASRSHLGRFFQSIIDGGAWDIVVRKGQQNLDILFGNYRLTLLVPVALVFVIYIMARPTSWGSRALQTSFDRAPVLRTGLISVLVMLTIGFLDNDSGVAIPAVGATIAVPFIIAVAMWSLEDEVRASRPARTGRRAARVRPAGRAPRGQATPPVPPTA